MKARILYRLAIVTAFTGIVFACNKSNNSSSGTTTTADMTTASDDQSRVSNENDAITNDANAAMSANSGVSGASITPVGRYGVTTDGAGVVDSGLICDGSITLDTANSTKTITITYTGGNCSGSALRTRTGTVVISIPAGTRWSDVGAVVTVAINVKITRLSDNKSITLTGTHTYTNVSGGSLIDLPNLQSITHTVTSSNMQITFDNGTTRTWSVARQRVYTYDGGVVITTTGTHSDGTHQGISEWGTNRFGVSFVTVIAQPLVIAQACEFRLVGGEVEVIRPDITAAVTFGLDATGAATGCPGTGTYYYEAVWTGANGKSLTVIAPY